MELTSMVEVLVRNALDTELRGWARRRHGWTSWFDAAPLDGRGTDDIRRARARVGRATGDEVHGRVVAELPLGFWRYLTESRYLTALWIPALHRASPGGSTDVRTRQREVASRMQQLHFLRNRAAHHEPIHARDLSRDLGYAVDLAAWISPVAGAWVLTRSTLGAVIAARP